MVGEILFSNKNKFHGSILKLMLVFTIYVLLSTSTNGASNNSSKDRLEEIILDKIAVNEYSGQYSIQVYFTSTINNDDFSKTDFSNFVSISPQIKCEIFSTKNGFVIRGDFKPEESYTIKISRGPVSFKGATLLQNITKRITIPKPSPQVYFPVKGRYVGKSKTMVVPVVIKHADEVYITISHIPERNLSIWEEASSWSRKKWEEIIVFNKRVHLEQIGENLYGFDLKPWIRSEQTGLYHVILKACTNGKNACASDNLYFIITNIGLIVKRSPDKAYIWAIDLNTGNPLKDVDIKGFTEKNIIAGICRTDERGYCHFSYNQHFKGKLNTIVAQSSNDYTYLPLKTTVLDLSGFPVSGIDIKHLPCLSAIVMERDLYRPGETLNYSIVIRNPADFTAMSLPITVKIRDPRDRILVEQQAVTDSFGIAEFSHTISADAITGVYFLELYMGDRLLKTRRFYIETFVPQRIKVEIQPLEEIFTRIEKITFKLKTEYLFGGPASGCSYNSYWELDPGDDKLFPGYHFGPIYADGEDYESIYWDQSGETGNNGISELKPAIDWQAIKKWPATLRVSADVYEAGSGRRVFKSIKIPVRLSHRYPGLKIASLTSCQRALIDGIIVDAFGKVVKEDASLEYSVYEIEYNYALTYSTEGSRRWEKTALRIPLFSKRKIAASRGHFSISIKIPECWKDLIVKVRDPLSGTESEILISGWENGEHPPNPERLKIRLSSKEVIPGSTIKATTRLPFKGHVLWILESSDKVLDFKWKNNEENESEVEFAAPDKALTLYVSAYLYKTSGADFMVSRAFGLNRLQVIPERIKAPIRIKAPKMIRPQEKLKLEISGPPGARVLLAVVDEGILQITNFESPDLCKLILAPHELYTETSEGLGWVYPGKALMSGGGMEESQNKPPTLPKFFKTFSMWKVLRLSVDGKVTVTTEVSHFQGDLRIMASVVTGSSFASISTHVKVTPEIAVLPTLPRIARQGDDIKIPIYFMNTTSRKIDGKIKVTVGNKSTTRIISLAPKASRIEEFSLTPSMPYGTMPVKIRLSYEKGKIWEDNYNIRILPATIKQIGVMAAKLDPFQNGLLNISDILSKWEPYGLKINIRVSYNPLVSNLTYIERLFKYPYGCLEQTSSRLLALINTVPIVRFMNSDSAGIEKIHSLITEGIARLIKLQDYSGGFTFWPGEDREDLWGSIYATYALIKAHQAGFYVPESVISRAISNLKGISPSPWRDFVLLEAGQLRTRKPVWAKKANDRESLLLLAWILHKEGFTEASKNALRKAHNSQNLTNPKAQTFYSPARLLALDVLVSSEVAPESAETRNIIGKFVKFFLESAGELTTQELAWTFSACKTLLKKNTSQKTPLQAILIVGNRKFKPSIIHDERTDIRVLTWQFDNHPGKQCRLKLLSNLPAWATILIKGFKKPSNIPSKKEILDIEVGIDKHKTYDSSTIKLKKRERFLIKVAITNKTSKPIQHVIAQIPVPASIEVLNPRLYNVKVKSPFKPSYIDLRDDEVIFFGNIPPGRHVLYFMAQALFNSKTLMPSPSIEAMYDPHVFGYGKPKVIIVCEETCPENQ